jgi:hypothetical protein
MRLEIAIQNIESGKDLQSLDELFQDWSIDVRVVGFHSKFEHI